jgi:hypothetical protein
MALFLRGRKCGELGKCHFAVGQRHKQDRILIDPLERYRSAVPLEIWISLPSLQQKIRSDFILVYEFSHPPSVMPHHLDRYARPNDLCLDI